MTNPSDLKRMIADHMEAGFLENIIDMFKHDRSLFSHLGHLINDGRGRVRMGAVALAETLKDGYPDEIVKAIPRIAEGLKNLDPAVRGDAAYLLEIIGHKDAIPYLTDALKDENGLVRDAVGEAMEKIT
jgi:hypothetical protein